MVEAVDQAPSETVLVPYEAAWSDLRQRLGTDKYTALLAVLALIENDHFGSPELTTLACAE